ncbi:MULTISPECIES: aminotransferase class I/II-fold pyridoxal phosphate-dependent enzyme [Francisella]|uniref:Aminotransferase class I/classII large domain-containing protein n=1 Tax=Francisella opportunistica TaxID=2016517 RepID=A0A345JRE2_9GAMM|nr:MULTISPECIES: aminotransferase class I/II-fold pyridoxal phosphate-dependent enzyme [Francisella]APC91614.1 2-amino-3-ketobutyrate coenzyme A ligase [Francisella sp. MA067296]AXH29888.1 hypothetical protein CGC43_04470 [Francisella opportunistica]AXH31535.1 hypothetical protein CGC44_04430 [Francisella opportunistica]AXH33183.1 hypothetical protein CGC45_04455 [Francisella opportunistica]
MQINENWFTKRFERTEKFLESSYSCARNIFKKSEKKNITLVDNKDYLEFVSCSYLGLHNDKQIINAVKESKALETQGFMFSSSRTRVISQEEKSALDKLAKIFSPYSPVLFQNLHTTHLGVIPLLLSGIFPRMDQGKPIHCIMDKYAHQSLKILIGIINQFCEVEFVDNTDIKKLSTSLKQIHKDNKIPFIIMDSVGSMGKIYPIKEIIDLVNKYCGYVYFDDAHGMSIIGKHGSGYVLQELNYKLNDRVFISASLSKGFGGQGGVVLMPHQEQIDFILQYCTTYTFSGPLSVPSLEVINKSCEIHLSTHINLLQQKLRNNLNYFDQEITDVKYNQLRNSFVPFRTIYIGNEEDAIKYYKQLKAQGILVTCAVYPVVEKSKAILRITLSASHEYSDIKLLVKNLKNILRLRNE